MKDLPPGKKPLTPSMRRLLSLHLNGETDSAWLAKTTAKIQDPKVSPDTVDLTALDLPRDVRDTANGRADVEKTSLTDARQVTLLSCSSTLTTECPAEAIAPTS